MSGCERMPSDIFSGDRHRSVVLSRDVAVCKSKKAELERYLGI